MSKMSLKILKFNQFVSRQCWTNHQQPYCRYYHSFNKNSSRVLFSKQTPTTNNATNVRHYIPDSTLLEPLPAFVDNPYSYAYGRSQTHLLYKSIGDLFDERLNYDTTHPVLISHHEKIKKNFYEFHTEVNNLAKAMYEHLGLKRGDVAGLWSCNCYDWILIQYACAKIGVILCTINPFYQTMELDYALRKSEIKALFMPGKQSRQEIVNRFPTIISKALEIENQTQLKLQLKSIISIDGQCYVSGDLPANQSNIKLFELSKLKQINGDLEKSILDAVLPDDPAMIMFTSGTTGKPKGACLSHFNLINNVLLSHGKHGFEDYDNLCVPLPFFHAFAGVLGNLSILVSKIAITIPCLKYNVCQLVEAINEHKSSHMFATPTLVIDVLNYLRYENKQIPSLRGLMAGGASVPVEVAHQFMETVPSCKDFRIGYGSTECGPCATICSRDYTIEEKTQTVGAPLDFVEVKLINPQTKKIVPTGETGEIHVRGHNVMLEYWKEPEKTREAIDMNGWYNTGDLGVMNEKGMVKIIGRTKELVIVGGENVYPREIEEVLYTHPAVETVNVIGVPDERKGEEICAWVQLHKDATATEQELRKFCQERITYFKVPKYILFVDGFPMTPTGKAQKFIMRDMTIKKLNLKK